jgi:putative NADH-flavin reductase
MDIGVLGATGVIGRAVVGEAVRRGHRVTAFGRDPGRFPAEPGPVAWRTADLLAAGVRGAADAVAGLDAVVNAISPGGAIDDQIAHADVLPRTARVLLAALESHPRTRLVVVGGGGSLETGPGTRLIDHPDFDAVLTDELGVPSEYRRVVAAHAEVLDLCRLSDRDWTYVSPSAGRIPPGERTGRYRVGGNQVLAPSDSGRELSAEDLAAAVVDEIEEPRHLQRRFTVAAH